MRHHPDERNHITDWRHQETQQLPDGPATLVSFPGTITFGAAHSALFGAVRRIREAEVFVSGPGAAPTAVWAARSGARVVTWHEHVAEHLSVTHSLAENGCRAHQACLHWDFTDLVPRTVDLALVHLPRGRERQREALRLGVAMLCPGGRLVFVGATREGVRAALQDATELCGSAGIVSRKGGYHAGVTYAPQASLPLPTVDLDRYEIELDGLPTLVRSYAGVFAHDRLDAGAAALIEAMQIEAGTGVLDLGCGTGLISLAALRRGAAVTATDVSARAVISTQETLAANRPTLGRPSGEPQIHLCMGAAAVHSSSVDTVVTNPPFHRGHSIALDVAQLFVQEAARVLKPGGRLFLVANNFLNYRPWLGHHLTAVEVISETPTFRVWTAQR